jgi:hypothetical protein
MNSFLELASVDHICSLWWKILEYSFLMVTAVVQRLFPLSVTLMGKGGDIALILSWKVTL